MPDLTKYSEGLAEARDAFQVLSRRVDRLDGVVSTRRSQEAATREDVVKLGLKVGKLEKVQKVLMLLLDRMTRKDLSSMDDLVTFGLKTVFPDRELSMKSDMVDTGKRIYIDMTTMDAGQPASKDQMGSASVIESFLIRLLCLLKTNGPKLLLLDETFGAVEQDRINAVGGLLEEMAARLGIDLLLITHNPGVSDSAIYRASLKAGNELHIQKIGGSTTAQVEIPVLEGAAPKKTMPAKKATRARKPKEVTG